MITSSSSPFSCKVGYGLLLEGDLYNHIRHQELAVYWKIGEHQGLRQPPHITVKRPFTISSASIDQHISLLETYASLIPAMTINYGPTKWFDDSTAYVAIDSLPIHHAHNSLLDLLGELHILPDDFEGQHYIPHSSVALEFSPHQTSTVAKALHEHATDTGIAHIQSVGLFLNIDKKHWIVIATQQLAGRQLETR